MTDGIQPPSGHIFRAERAHGPVWYAKYRLPDGRQVQKKLGPAWTGRGRPANGLFTKRTAEDWLGSVLDQARRGTLPGMVQTRVTFADAAAEWLRYIEHDRGRKPSTVSGYRSIVGSELLPRFGQMALESITPAAIESWQASMSQAASTRTKALVLMHGIFQRARKVWALPANPVADVEKPPVTRSGALRVFSPEEVWALVRAAASEADGALYLTAAFTGPRMGELLLLRWRDVDWVGDDDLAFAGEAGSYLDGSALRRRYKAALAAGGLRPLRFHDLRHTFGTRVIAKADIRRVQEWMGHADIQTTMRYLHFAPRAEDAAVVAEAFAVAQPADDTARVR